jgi:hypothetical protein
MMIDGGLILMLIGALALATAPTQRVLAGRRWVRTEVIEPALRQAFPLPPARQDLERLVISAEASIESSKLRRAQSRRAIRSRRKI